MEFFFRMERSLKESSLSKNVDYIALEANIVMSQNFTFFRILELCEMCKLPAHHSLCQISLNWQLEAQFQKIVFQNLGFMENDFMSWFPWYIYYIIIRVFITNSAKGRIMFKSIGSISQFTYVSNWLMLPIDLHMILIRP